MYQHLPMLVLRAAATLSSVFMYLSPFGMVRNISKAKSTEPHSFWPILAALGNSTLWTTYGLLSFDIFPLFVTNFIGALLNLYYCRVFYLYEKKRILFLTSSFILFSLLICGPFNAVTVISLTSTTTLLIRGLIHAAMHFFCFLFFWCFLY